MKTVKFKPALLTAALLSVSLTVSAAGIVTGTQQTVTRNLVVAGSAEATVKITPATNVLAGVTTGGLLLANWDASTTGGTIAYRLNPTIVQMYSTPSYGGGYLRNSADATQRIEVMINPRCTNQGVITATSGTLSGQWRVCPEGSESVAGTITSVGGKIQTLTGGAYPVAIDAVAWTF